MSAIISYTLVAGCEDNSFFTVYVIDTRWGRVTDRSFDEFGEAWAFASQNGRKPKIDPNVPEKFLAEVAA